MYNLKQNKIITVKSKLNRIQENSNNLKLNMNLNDMKKVTN